MTLKSLRAKAACLATVATVTVAVAPAAAAVTVQSSAELRLANKINKGRARLGKAALTLDTYIRGQARTHSTNMANGVVPFGHQGFSTRVNNIRANDGGTQEACENVARASGYTDYVEVVKVFNKGWKTSTTGHRECMYSLLGWNGNQYGLGIVRSGNSWWGTLIVVRDTTPAN